jgi:hypothetical protein
MTLAFSVDLDIESGTGTYYAAFVNRIRTLSANASKKYASEQ